jgi:hypothetical protein
VSRITPGAANTAQTAGYARVVADPSVAAPAGFAVFSLRQGGVLVSEATVTATAPMRSGRIFAASDELLRTGVALANPNPQPATLSFYFTDAAGRDFNAGSLTIPANGQIATFLDEPLFNAASLSNSTFTFTSDIAIGGIALRGYTNERSEFLMTTLPVVDLSRAASALKFPQFAVGGGWTTEILLVNPGAATLNGTVSLRSGGMPYNNFDYSIPPKSARSFNASAGTPPEPPGILRTGVVRLLPTAGSEAPDVSLVLSLKNGPTTVSSVGVTAVRNQSPLHIYAENSQFVQTGIAIANPTSDAAVVNVELIAASGEPAGATTIALAGDGQVVAFLNQISGLPTPANFEGVLRLSTTSVGGLAVMGLRGRYNERGEFLITSTPPAEAIEAGANLFPHIIDGGGYSTQFVLLRTAPAQASTGAVKFYTQSGQPLELSVR